uniref:Uncharacterized protein n=1 Tax=Lepeophtheirus salmonis TaxID=72036 RepID=A0A0K2TAC6_LEPSM
MYNTMIQSQSFIRGVRRDGLESLDVRLRLYGGCIRTSHPVSQSFLCVIKYVCRLVLSSIHQYWLLMFDRQLHRSSCSQ